MLDNDFSICKVSSTDCIDFEKPYIFYAKAEDEISLVCESSDVPADAPDIEPGWRGFRICGVLDFSLVGIISRITGILASCQIGLFAVSIYNTDYIFVKEAEFDRAVSLLVDNGYGFV